MRRYDVFPGVPRGNATHSSRRQPHCGQLRSRAGSTPIASPSPSSRRQPSTIVSSSNRRHVARGRTFSVHLETNVYQCFDARCGSKGDAIDLWAALHQRDMCEDEAIAFVLGHALYMKMIHGGKAKTDKIDAAKLANMLRGGLFPLAYVYPRAKRQTRDLLRRRSFFVRQRAQLIAHIQNTNTQFNLPPFPKKLTYAGNRSVDIAERFADPSTQLAVSADLNLIAAYDKQIAELERHLVKNAKVDDPVTFGLLRTVPGIGPILGLTRLDEIDTIGRFPEPGHFLSYARLVRCAHESAGKVKGSGGKKIGNAHLKWAFSEAACLMLRSCLPVKAWMQRQAKKKGKRKALGILEAKIGRTVYHLWRKAVPFDVKRFSNG